jgi:hypothetical protein
MFNLTIKRNMPKKLFLCLLALSLSACAPNSTVGVSPAKALISPAQFYLQSSAHWSVVANDISELVGTKLKSIHVDADPTYVAINSGNSEFGVAMRDFIITKLIEKGIKISQTKKNAQVLEIKFQTIKFNGHRMYAPGMYAPDTELIVTSSLLKEQSFMMRLTSIYYVSGDDRHLYEKNKCRGPFNDSFFSKDC